MRLVEIIRGDEADPLVVSALAEFISLQLGKGVVFCKDTPNFIGNRIMAIHGGFVMEYALDNGYRFEEVDAVTGPLIGRPKTATFRLQDLVGIDVAHGVAQNLHDLIPGDEYRDVLKSPASARVVGALLERGDLGNKTGQGFYKKTRGEGGKPVFLVLNPETMDYEPPQPVTFPAVAAVSKIRDLGERLQALFAEEHRKDRGAQLAWATVSHLLSYAAARVREIAYDLPSLDQALRWGFAYEAGPFELWDRLGVAETVERMEASGVAVAGWVKEMLAAGCATFYRYDGRRVTGAYHWKDRGYRDLPVDERHIRVEDLHLAGKEIEGNPSASLLDLGDGVLLLEFHSKMNTLDGGIVSLMRRARELLDDDAWKGLVIGNDGTNFTVGANLQRVVEAALQGQLDEVKKAAGELQGAIQALRFAPKPTVAALHGMVLGGGCEIAMGVPHAMAAAESYIGLVETGVGLLPAGSGMKELVRRRLSPVMEVADADPLPVAQKIVETVGMAKVSTSAAEAAELGFFGDDLRVVMNRDHLLYEAKSEVLALDAAGYVPPAPALLYAGGRDLLAALKVGVWSLAQAGFASEHDAVVVGEVAHVLAGGELSSPQWVDEAYFLELEAQGFVRLLGTEKTQARIRHTLETGKPLRN
jgi:3-hydroxyacyl-CoA dehydrogenase